MWSVRASFFNHLIFKHDAFGIVLLAPFVRGPLELSFPPMGILARGIKLPNVASVQCPHDADARHHRRAAELDDQEQGLDRGLPLIEILFGLRQAGDVVAGIAQSHDLALTRQQDKIIERGSPDGNRLQTCDQLFAFRNVLNVQFAFSSAGPGASISGRIVALS